MSVPPHRLLLHVLMAYVKLQRQIAVTTLITDDCPAKLQPLHQPAAHPELISHTLIHGTPGYTAVLSPVLPFVCT